MAGPRLSADACEQRTVTISDSIPEAVIVMPDAGQGLVRDGALRRWLSRATLRRDAAPEPVLDRVRRATGQSDDSGAPAALRLWGQTGARPDRWMAAADPVFLEPGLSRTRLHRLLPDELSSGELRELIDELESRLGGDQCRFACVGQVAYLQSDTALTTPREPPEVLHGLELEGFLPRGADAAGYMQLLSEIQMTLHASRLSQRRESLGLRPVNSLWIWGGGVAPAARPRRMPALFSNDAMLRGYWLSAAATISEWPGRLLACAEISEEGFVADVPEIRTSEEEHVARLAGLLDDARRLLDDRAVGRLRLLFRDGLWADVERRHAWRFWRRDAALLGCGDASS